MDCAPPPPYCTQVILGDLSYSEELLSKRPVSRLYLFFRPSEPMRQPPSFFIGDLLSSEGVPLSPFRTLPHSYLPEPLSPVVGIPVKEKIPHTVSFFQFSQLSLERGTALARDCGDRSLKSKC